ncbi:MAG TPA: SDR family oxidoreductase [Anaerolineae bacterium]|nr:SDR family oxidoreductase [Anaerolineae bacterium]
MTRILITGASGLLGLNLAIEAAKHHEVFGVVNNHPVKTEAFKIMKADLLKPGTIESVFDETQPDWVIHCAALTNLDACDQTPELAYRLNADLPQKLATYVGRSGARMIHVSTDAVFDGQRGDYSEEDAPNPINVYARTKFEGEQAVASVYPRAIIARVNMFGWSMTGKRSLSEFFFYNLQKGQSVMGFTDVYFCPLLVNDLADLFLQMLSKGLSGLYHVVSNECMTKYKFGVHIARKFGLDESLIQPVLVKNSSLTAARAPRLSLRVDKLINDLGQTPPKLIPSINKLYDLYLEGYPQKLMKMKAE